MRSWLLQFIVVLLLPKKPRVLADQLPVVAPLHRLLVQKEASPNAPLRVRPWRIGVPPLRRGRRRRPSILHTHDIFDDPMCSWEWKFFIY